MATFSRWLVLALLSGCGGIAVTPNNCAVPPLSACRDYEAWAYCPMPDGTWWVAYPSGEAVRQSESPSTFIGAQGEVLGGDTVCYVEAR
jgi:hypothetical protein